MKTRVLALNAYHGGSHQAFLDGWMAHSRHEFTPLTLPAFKWKWRMRHAAVTLSEQVARLIQDGADWDAVFCTDMLNLAEFLGLCPPLRNLPTIAYFHENQLTYPVLTPDPRDLHFAFTNLTTALAATTVWFNSAFHRDEFLAALEQWLRRMPDHAPQHAVASIRAKSEIHPPGIQSVSAAARPAGGPLRIVWVSRWEHDKAPETFFHGLFQLADRGCDFRVSVLGERFDRMPEIFGQARRSLSDRIDHWGFLPNRADYQAALAQADVVVSTARHEFFGIGVLEAVAAGCFPLVPRRLAYPEVLGDHAEFFHDDTPAGLVDRLWELAQRKKTATVWPAGLEPVALTGLYSWPIVAAAMDDAIDRQCSTIALTKT
ncbi:MAG: glycosyltransferase [Pirellulaceae bacterium]|nr:glycosyltransferase [Pirellulaceae bacterium]